MTVSPRDRDRPLDGGTQLRILRGATCEFDHLEETKEVADAASAHSGGYGGEQGIRRRPLPVDNPEPRGGRGASRICTITVAIHPLDAGLCTHGHMRRACSARLVTSAIEGSGGTPAISTSRISPRVLQPTAPFHEFKGDTDIPVSSPTARSRSWRAWFSRIPTGPGFGVTIDLGVRSARPKKGDCGFQARAAAPRRTF